MKRIKYLFLLAVALFGATVMLSSCGGDDSDELGGTGGSSSVSISGDDFIEITYNGKTYKEYPRKVMGYYLYGQLSPFNEDCDLTYLMEDLFSKYGLEVTISLTHYSDKNRLVAQKPGSYPFSKDMARDENSQKSLCLTINDILIGSKYYDCVSGTHNVSAIKKVGETVKVAGSFTAMFKNDISISGKYCMTLPND